MFLISVYHTIRVTNSGGEPIMWLPITCFFLFRFQYSKFITNLWGISTIKIVYHRLFLLSSFVSFISYNNFHSLVFLMKPTPHTGYDIKPLWTLPYSPYTSQFSRPSASQVMQHGRNNTHLPLCSLVTPLQCSQHSDRWCDCDNKDSWMPTLHNHELPCWNIHKLRYSGTVHQFR